MSKNASLPFLVFASFWISLISKRQIHDKVGNFMFLEIMRLRVYFVWHRRNARTFFLLIRSRKFCPGGKLTMIWQKWLIDSVEQVLLLSITYTNTGVNHFATLWQRIFSTNFSESAFWLHLCILVPNCSVSDEYFHRWLFRQFERFRDCQLGSFKTHELEGSSERWHE